jgi:crotonobetainyl-CoA:carnitine CoA-transferase CaiB-like acyl-CoA transferase
MTSSVNPLHTLAGLLRTGGLSDDALEHVTLGGSEPVLRSSFAVGTAAQSSVAAAALAAAEVWHLRCGQRQRVTVDMRAAAAECTGYFAIDGRVPEPWDRLSGLYPCGTGADAGWVRVHANFPHHRDGALQLLGLPPGAQTSRDAVELALSHWRVAEFEQRAAEAGLVVAAVRSFADWDDHPQASAIAALPLFTLERIGEAQPRTFEPLPAAPEAAPLSGIRVLDLTRILAGPVCGRTLAAYGAEVMLINSPTLPNIEAIIDTSRGKLSAHVDLHTHAGRQALTQLLPDTDVFVQGYRPGALETLGFGPELVARVRPGIVYVSLSAYGHRGPWAERRGFDSLVQTATGFNHAEAEAAGSAWPRPLPVPILDYASGFLMAFGAQAALLRQIHEGGSWHVRVSLAQTALWIRTLGRVANGFEVPRIDVAALAQRYPCGYGQLDALPHAAEFSLTPARWLRPAMPPGSHRAAWPPSPYRPLASGHS